MNYEDLFFKYGRINDEAEIRIHDCLIRPAKLNTVELLKYYDDSACETIKRCQELIENLTLYRQDIAKRYSELETMAYILKLDFKRRIDYTKNKIYYDIRIIKQYEDKTENTIFLETFPGKERANALKRFEQIKKEHNGIIVTKNI